jgi:hypothetical protein
MRAYQCLCGAALAVWLSTGAQAATISAMALNESVTSFTIGFSDTNTNGLLDFEEIESFSGVSGNNFGENPVVFMQILGIPTIAQIAAPFIPVGGAFDEDSWANLDVWLFGGDGNPSSTAATRNWSYQISGLDDPVSVVPLPGGLPLLLAGLAALVVLRGRRARA